MVIEMERRSLKSLVAEQNEEILTRKEGHEREVLEEAKRKVESPHILVITGPRRAGKSTLLIQIMNNLLEEDSFYYLNFQDERLVDFKPEDFNTLYEVLIELYGERDTFIFDEIQNVEGWETFVNRMHKEGNKVILTGSNANLLSKELSTHLTGRHLDIELLPFSFREFLKTEEGIPSEKEKLITKEKGKAKRLFDEYLETGGFPEKIIYDQEEILQNLYQDIVTRDIIGRHGIKKTKTFREIALHLMSNPAKPFSYNSLKNNYEINSVHTVKDYVSHLEESYLVFELEKYSDSVKKQKRGAKKIYPVDTGLIHSVSFRSTEDYGRMLENLVFLELRRRDGEVYYHKEDHECDFLVKEGTEIEQAIQVTSEMTAENKERELKGLEEAMERYDLDQGLLLTYSQEEEIEEEGKEIEVKPIWLWLLEQ